MIANRKYTVEAVAVMNRLDADALADRLRPIPAKNLAVLRDAVRTYAVDGLYTPAMASYVVDAITAEITRRWA